MKASAVKFRKSVENHAIYISGTHLWDRTNSPPTSPPPSTAADVFEGHKNFAVRLTNGYFDIHATQIIRNYQEIGAILP